MKKSILVSIIFAIILANSCKSVPENGKDFVYVMIYDYENNGIKDVAIYIDNKLIGESDINGRFFIPVVKEGSRHKINLIKNGFDSIEEDIQIRPDIVLYYKIGSAKYYFSEAEKALDKGALDLAFNSIEKAINIEGKIEFLFLKSVLLYKTGKNEEALEIIKKLEIIDTNEFIKKTKEYYEN